MTDATQLRLEASGYVADKPYNRRPGSCRHRDNGVDPVAGCRACDARTASALNSQHRIDERLAGKTFPESGIFG
jgi:hypothetical protein